MKKLILPVLVFMILPLWYLLSFGIGFDAADWSWPYSLYHFLDYKRQIGFSLFILILIVVMIYSLDRNEGSAKRWMVVSVMGLLVFLFLHLGNMFFSLNSLSKGMVGSSQYNPVILTLESMFVKFGSWLVAMVAMCMSVLDRKKRKA